MSPVLWPVWDGILLRPRPESGKGKRPSLQRNWASVAPVRAFPVRAPFPAGTDRLTAGQSGPASRGGRISPVPATGPMGASADARRDQFIAIRRLADARAHAAGRVRRAVRLAGGPGRDRRPVGRLSSTPAATRSGPTSPTSMPPGPMCSKAARGAVRSRHPACPGEGDFRRQHAVLRLALSAVLPVRCGRARAAALRGSRWRCGSRRPSCSISSVRAILRLREPPPNASADARAIDPLWLLFAAAFPAVLVNAGHGQNGFLTAALLGGALVMLDRRPASRASCSALLSYKPQFGLMIPLVLIATQRWRVFGVAVVTVAALAAITPSRSARPFGARSSPRPNSAASSSSKPAAPACTSSRACSHGFACGADLSPWRTRPWRHRHRARRHAGPALAERSAVSAQGRRPDRRVGAVDALRARLRHDGARARDRIPCHRWIAARLQRLAEDRARRALARAYRRAQHGGVCVPADRRLGDDRSTDLFDARRTGSAADCERRAEQARARSKQRTSPRCFCCAAK